ncbi:MAG: retropepsin-like aspartic protease [Chromatiaceae bacterium]
MMKPNTLRLLQLYVAFSVLSFFQVVLAEEVRLVKDGGVYHLPVKINDAIELKFVVDTGAADVLIPADVVLTLMRTGTISKSDFLGKGSYQMADGSLAEHANFNLRSLQIGSHLIRNIHASIGSVEGSLLLGQSALEQLEPWRMETKRGVFVFGEDTGIPSRKPRQEQPVDYSKPLEGGVIYFAADKAPTEHVPPEAPLCYKFQVSSPEEQLNKLKKKYPTLYDFKISKNKDGSKNLVAKRKDEVGNVANYFYSTNPDECSKYQERKQSISSNISTTNNTSGLDGVYVGNGANADLHIFIENGVAAIDLKGQGCIGSLEGAVQVMSMNSWRVVATDPTCVIDMRRDGPLSFYVNQGPGCTHYHGFHCEFTGHITKNR